jgi:hypothetical protein
VATAEASEAVRAAVEGASGPQAALAAAAAADVGNQRDERASVPALKMEYEAGGGASSVAVSDIELIDEAPVRRSAPLPTWHTNVQYHSVCRLRTAKNSP